MPLSSGLSIHDDTKHKGSAKRDTVSGVAAIDLGGNVEDIFGHDCEIIHHKDAANGYAGLDASVEIPVALLKTGVANGIAGLDASAKLSLAQLTVINKVFKLGDDLVHSYDAEASTGAMDYVKLKTITLDTLYPTPSTLRIKFDLKIDGGTTAYGRIYKNGAAVGTIQSTSSTSYVTFSEDLSYAEGDALEVYGYRSGGGSCRVCNFRVYGEEHQQLYHEAVNDSELGVVDPLIATNS